MDEFTKDELDCIGVDFSSARDSLEEATRAIAHAARELEGAQAGAKKLAQRLCNRQPTCEVIVQTAGLVVMFADYDDPQVFSWPDALQIGEDWDQRPAKEREALAVALEAAAALVRAG